MDTLPPALKDMLPVRNVNKDKKCLIEISFFRWYIKQNQHVMLLVQYQRVHPRSLGRYNWFSSPSSSVKLIQASLSADFPAISSAHLTLSLHLLGLKFDRMTWLFVFCFGVVFSGVCLFVWCGVFLFCSFFNILNLVIAWMSSMLKADMKEEKTKLNVSRLRQGTLCINHNCIGSDLCSLAGLSFFKLPHG